MIRVVPAYSVFLFSSWALAATSLPAVEVRAHPVVLTFPAEAVIEAVQLSTVAAQVAGRVLEVKADAGQEVSKGEVLMRLDPRESSSCGRGRSAVYQCQSRLRTHPQPGRENSCRRPHSTRPNPISMPLPPGAG